MRGLILAANGWQAAAAEVGCGLGVCGSAFFKTIFYIVNLPTAKKHPPVYGEVSM